MSDVYLYLLTCGCIVGIYLLGYWVRGKVDNAGKRD